MTTPDSEAAEDYAEQVGVDPTQEEIDQYLRLEGDDPEEPPAAVEDPQAG